MPLVLPSEYPIPNGVSRAERRDALRIGIINIMPRLEEYEPLLLRRLDAAPMAVEPVFLRLASHGYTSSDADHLRRFYRSIDDVGRLDGLILTGAPVEQLAFEDVHYWPELTGVLERASASIRSTLGICWGGMALGALLGVPKRLFPRKLFGVFEHEALASDELLPRGETMQCAHSRHSGCEDAALDAAARTGTVQILASSAATGHTVFATPRHRFVSHLGHPEYESDRLVYEWERDRTAQRTDVDAPVGLALEAPTTTWRHDSERFFGRWLAIASA